MPMSNPQHIDDRSPEEIAVAQRGLLKILAFATAVPNVWVVMLAWNGYNNMDHSAPYDDVQFAQFVVIWGLLSPVVWLLCYSYTLFKTYRGDMRTGAYLPMIPALWFIFWFTIQFVRQSDWFIPV